MKKSYLTTEAPERFASPGGIADEVLLNTRPMQFMLIHQPSLHEIEAAIEEYSLLRMEERWREVLETPNTGKSTGKVIKAFLLTGVSLYYVSHDLVKAKFGWVQKQARSAIREIHKLDVDDQRALLEPLKPKSIAEAIALYPDRTFDVTGYRFLRKMLQSSANAVEFFEKLANELFDGIHATDWTLGSPKMAFFQSRIYEFFSLSLRKGWLLFPYISPRSKKNEGKALAHKDAIKSYENPVYAPPEMFELAKATEGLAGVSTSGPSTARFVRRLLLCSSYRTTAQSSTALFERCIDLANSGADDAHRPMAEARSAYNALLKLHGAHHPTAPQQQTLYFRKKVATLDEFVSFDEHVAKHPHLEPWATRCSEYLRSLKVSAQVVGTRRTTCATLLEFVAQHPSPPARPEFATRAFINDFTKEGPCFRNYLAKIFSHGVANDKLNEVGAIFTFVQDRLRIEHINPATEPPWFLNPVDIKFDRFEQRHKAGSSRKAIAADIMEEMRRVLIEDDYAWAKQWETDWAYLLDKDEGILQQVWVPSAAICLYTLLSLPLRTLQARMFDTGEGDAEIFDFDSGRMVKNPNQLPVDGKLDPKRSEGFIKVMSSGLSADPELVGLWIPVNKTSDEGYPIPWVSDELMKQLKYQRDFILRYTQKPLMYGIDEAQGHRNTPDELKVRQEKFYCLFRDPSANRAESDSLPVARQKLLKMWGRLCFEVEKRINARATSSHERVKLTREVQRADPSPAHLYDLHTLRVSGITDLLDRGVPLNIVSEYVAGHATYIMTLWYDKPHPGAVRRAMMQASDQIGDSVGALPRFSEAEIGRMRPYLLANSQYEGFYTGFDALEENVGLIQVRQSGICPGTRCEEGGIDEKGRSGIPVPVGDRGPSCPQCRFFLTGPAFLLGQAIEGNQLILKIRNKVGALAKLREKTLDAEDAGSTREADLMRGQADVEERQLNDMLTEWWHRMRFYENSIQKLEAYRKSANDIRSGEVADIVLLRSHGSDELNFGFGSATELELKHFLSTCTEILPELVNESLGAHQDIELAMGKFLAINDQHELTSMFFKLDEDQRLTAANLMVELMNRAAHSPIQAAELLAGKIQLNALPNLKSDFSTLLSGMNIGIGEKSKQKVLIDA